MVSGSEASHQPCAGAPGGAGSSLTGRLTSLLIDLAYVLALLLLTPWLLFLILVRRRGVGSLAERLGGVVVPTASGPRAWLHAVSVGELEAALPLVQELEERGLEVVVSTTTASAQELARRRLPGRRVCYFPIDFGVCVRRALSRVRPDVIVLIELELWPNLILAANARRVPVVVVNGRITERSERRMRWVRPLIRAALRRLSHIEVQTDVYRDRLLALGAAPEQLAVTGNLKFDRAPIADPAAVRREFVARFSLAEGVPTWIAGSTHDGEEAALLEAQRELAAQFPGLLLVLAPRHVERAPEVARRVAEYGLDAVLYSAILYSATLDGAANEMGGAGKGTASERTDGQPDVIIVDVTGELARLYAAADVAYVGGSLIARGGHNLLEPVLAGTPVLHGPHTENFREITQILADAGAAQQVSDGVELTACLRHWLGDAEERARRVAAGRAVIEHHGGAAARAAEHIQRVVRSTAD